jgi:hypothetical protein
VAMVAAPGVEEAVPGLHAMQVVLAVASLVSEYVPARQGVQMEAAASE